MSKKTLVKVPFIRARLNRAMEEKNLSIRKLGAILSERGEGSEKTIRRALKDGETEEKKDAAINVVVLDAIARILDVAPSYLSGEYDRPLKELDGDSKELYEREFLNPKRFPYRFAYVEQVDYRVCLEQLLSLWGISRDELLQMDDAKRMRMEDDLWCHVYHALSRYFPYCMRPQEYYDYGKRPVRIEDFYEMMVPDPLELEDAASRSPEELALEKKYAVAAEDSEP